METRLKVKGMHCISCVQKIERYYDGIEGISARPNLIMDEIKFEHDDNWDVDSINETLRVIGYKGVREEDYKKSWTDYLIQIEVVIAVLIGMFLMLPHMVSAIYELFTQEHIMFPIIFSETKLHFSLAFVSQFIIGRRFYKGAWRSLKHGLMGMDLLIVIGTTTAFVYSFVNWANNNFNNMHHDVFFDVAAEVIAFIMVGKLVEKKVQDRSKKSLLNKLSNKPTMANVIVGEDILKVKVTELKIGDVIVVRKGERVPIDGTITDGLAYFDEAMITGESKQVKKIIGDKVIGSTINLSDSIRIKVSTTDKDSVMSKIIDKISYVASEKSPVQKMADKASNIFIPVVLAAAGVTYLVWRFASFPNLGFGTQNPNEITNTLAVLIIACPCMLGLATPLSMLVSSTLASDNGIIYNNIEAFEKVKDIDVVCFDKTGTITEGKLNIENYNCGQEMFENLVTLELLSTHPIAGAFMDWKHDNQFDAVEIKDFNEIEGKGVSGIINGIKYFVGSKEYISTIVNIPASATVSADLALANNKVVVYASSDKEFITHIELSDTLKPGIKNSIRMLHEKGIQTIMITGDNQVTANLVANELGISEVHSQVSPEEKSDIVKSLQDNGKRVAFIGDGINDSIALKQANLSISMEDGSDLAINSSDITLMNNDIIQIINAISISQRALKKIKQNLTIAFTYNSVAILLAAFGYIPPIFAAFAMILESLSVVSNTMLLNKQKLVKKEV